MTVIIQFKGRHILIATGSIPMNLNIPGSENIITSDQFLEIGYDNLPERIVFIGGGYISFEFAQYCSSALEQTLQFYIAVKQPLEHFDSDLVRKVGTKKQRYWN